MISPPKTTFLSTLLKLKDFMPWSLKLRFCLLVLLMLAGALSEMMSIGMIIPFLSVITSPDLVFAHPIAQPVIEIFSIKSNKDLAFILTVGFCLIAVTAASIRLIALWFQTRFCYSLGADLSTQIYKNSLYQPYPVHVARNSSEFISTIFNKTFQSITYAIRPVLNILSSVLLLIGIVSVLMIIEPVVTFFAFILFGALYGIVMLLTRSRLDIDSKNLSVEQDAVLKKLQEGFGSIRDILVSNTQEVYLKSYSSSFSALQSAWSSVEIISAIPRFAIEAIGIVSIALLTLYLSNEPAGLIGALPILGAMALGAQRMLPVLQLIYASISFLRAGREPLTDMLDILEMPSQESIIKASHKSLPYEKQIVIENLKFKYTPDSPWILDGLDLKISKGDMIGIIGSTGSGKSTLIDILMGLLRPTDGTFKVDDEIVTDINKHGWQTKIAHVPQSIFLIDASITENIALGTPLKDIDFELVKKSARKAQIHDVISSWDDKYETIVGERGIRISGGQIQRIAIARALYKNASVIIFDEATSALDSETESLVMESIVGLDKDLTIIIVAHRLSTLKDCTHIIELEDGKVVRRGKYNEIV